MKVTRRYIQGPETEVTLCPLGDIQWAGDEEEIAYDHLLTHVSRCLNSPHPLFVGMGDYIDFASPSTRDALRAAVKYDTANRVLHDTSTRLVDDIVARVLGPTKGKWVGLVQGHHHYRCANGQDSDEYLCHLLKAEFLDELGIVHLKWRKGEKVVGEVVVMARHGEGGGRMPWAPVQKLYNFSPHVHADVLLEGHHTKKAKASFDRIVSSAPEGQANRIDHDTVLLVGTGGWMKGYLDGRRTYVSVAGMAPVALGQPWIHIRPSFKRDQWSAWITEES